MRALRFIGPCVVLAALVGCPGQVGDERNPFLAATETFGVSIFGDEAEEAGRAGAAAEVEFRRMLTLTLANNDTTGELNTSWVAWVSTGSIRSAEQQDALLSNGYVQLTREVDLGTAYTLPAGTFVFNGPGPAGATVLRLDAAAEQDGSATPTEVSFDLITPDALLVFSHPPVSCDTVAFYFTLDGLPLDVVSEGQFGAAYGGATRGGSFKTLAQVDVYECSPFRPGLFFRAGGGARQANEFFEGEDIRVDFARFVDVNDDAAFVTIGTAPDDGTEGQP